MKFNAHYYLNGEVGDAKRQIRNAVRNFAAKLMNPFTKKGCAGFTYREFYLWVMDWIKSVRPLVEAGLMTTNELVPAFDIAATARIKGKF